MHVYVSSYNQQIGDSHIWSTAKTGTAGVCTGWGRCVDFEVSFEIWDVGKEWLEVELGMIREDSLETVPLPSHVSPL